MKKIMYWITIIPPIWDAVVNLIKVIGEIKNETKNKNQK